MHARIVWHTVLDEFPVCFHVNAEAIGKLGVVVMRDRTLYTSKWQKFCPTVGSSPVALALAHVTANGHAPALHSLHLPPLLAARFIELARKNLAAGDTISSDSCSCVVSVVAECDWSSWLLGGAGGCCGSIWLQLCQQQGQGGWDQAVKVGLGGAVLGAIMPPPPAAAATAGGELSASSSTTRTSSSCCGCQGSYE